MSKLSVLIVDDHSILREGLKTLLSSKGDMVVAADASSGVEAVEKAVRLRPDVIVMDLLMPGMDGVETTRTLLGKWPGANVLIFTSYGTADGIAHALAAGARGAIIKNAALDELVAAIRIVAAGGKWVSSEIRRIIRDEPPVQPLSHRQGEILAAIVRGMTNADIASQLGIGIDMVKSHVNTLFAKIGASNRAEAAAIALRKHLLKV